jgi:UrcA family protein
MIRSARFSGRYAPAAAAVLGILGQSFALLCMADGAPGSRLVHFADLDLSRPAAAQVLYARIQAAALVSCTHYFFATDTDRSRCVRDAGADAVTRINQPALTAVYAARNKTSTRH